MCRPPDGMIGQRNELQADSLPESDVTHTEARDVRRNHRAVRLAVAQQLIADRLRFAEALRRIPGQLQSVRSHCLDLQLRTRWWRHASDGERQGRIAFHHAGHLTRVSRRLAIHELAADQGLSGDVIEHARQQAGQLVLVGAAEQVSRQVGAPLAVNEDRVASDVVVQRAIAVRWEVPGDEHAAGGIARLLAKVRGRRTPWTADTNTVGRSAVTASPAFREKCDEERGAGREVVQRCGLRLRCEQLAIGHVVEEEAKAEQGVVRMHGAVRPTEADLQERAVEATKMKILE